MLSEHQKHWGIDQWVAYLKEKEIPVLYRTKAIFNTFRDLPDAEREQIAVRDVTAFVYGDPYFALKLLRKAERLRSGSHLGHETTTALGAVMQTGFQELMGIVQKSSTSFCDYHGANECEFRACMAASIARSWASLRADVSPEEVTMASLLSETGELMLWHFAAELPIKAEAELASGRVKRSIEAQQEAVGFSFRQLTLALCAAWELPGLIGQLIKGTDSPRANIARIAVDTARHIISNERNAALLDDVLAIAKVLPGAAHHQLLAGLPIPEDYKEHLLEALGESHKQPA